ncbi:MAG: carboxypeptidase-like regulatory domain-containing protein [Nanoarchaeota archaeon]
MSDRSKNLKIGLGAGLLAFLGAAAGFILFSGNNEKIPIPPIEGSKYEAPEKPVRKNRTVQPIATAPFREVPEVTRPVPPREDELGFVPENYLIGRVVNSKGEALNDVLIMPQEPFFLGGKRDGLERILGYSNAKGEFKIPVPDVVQYDVRAEFGNRIVFARNVSPGVPFDVVFQKGANVKASVLDSDDKTVDAELDMRMVYPFPGDVTIKPAKRENGAYVFQGIDEGAYILTARKDNSFASESVAVFDEDRETTLVLPKGVRIKGLVVDEESRNGIGGARIKIGQRESNFETELTSGADGSFDLNLPRGEYLAEVSAEGYVPTDATKLNSDERDRKFALKRGNSLEGRVLDESGGVAGARLAVVDSYGNPISKFPTRSTATDGRGNYGIVASQDSSFGLLVYQEDHVPQFVYPAEVDGQKIKDIALKREGLSLSGNVFTEGMASPENLPIVLKPHSEWIPKFSPASAVFTYVTRTNRDGVFSFERLAPGKYEITAKTSAGSVSDTVEVRENVDGVSLNLVPGFDLHVRVQDQTGRVAPETDVLIYSPERKYFGRSDNSGIVVLRKVIPGDYSVLAYNQRTLQEERSNFTAKRDDPNLEINFNARDPLVINVYDKDTRKPIEHVDFNYLVKVGRGFASKERKLIDRNGYFRIPFAGDGIKSVSVGALGYSSERISLDGEYVGPKTVFLEMKRK